jgi:hypothetical protein
VGQARRRWAQAHQFSLNFGAGTRGSFERIDSPPAIVIKYSNTFNFAAGVSGFTAWGR